MDGLTEHPWLECKFGPHWSIVINKNLPRNSLGSKAQTLGQACTRINYLISGVSNDFTNSHQGQQLKHLDETYQFAPLVPTGTEFQSLALIRNYSGHGNPYNSVLQTDADARQMLKGTLFIFNKMRHCALLRGN